MSTADSGPSYPISPPSRSRRQPARELWAEEPELIVLAQEIIRYGAHASVEKIRNDRRSAVRRRPGDPVPDVRGDEQRVSRVARALLNGLYEQQDGVR